MLMSEAKHTIADRLKRVPEYSWRQMPPMSLSADDGSMVGTVGSCRGLRCGNRVSPRTWRTASLRSSSMSLSDSTGLGAAVGLRRRRPPTTLRRLQLACSSLGVRARDSGVNGWFEVSYRSIEVASLEIGGKRSSDGRIDCNNHGVDPLVAVPGKRPASALLPPDHSSDQ